MEEKLQVMIGSSNWAIWERFAKILESKGIVLAQFHSIKQVCKALAQKNVLFVFCEKRLIDGTYEDLIVAAKNVRSRARIVVTGLEPDQFDSLAYCGARELAAFFSNQTGAPTKYESSASPEPPEH